MQFCRSRRQAEHSMKLVPLLLGLVGASGLLVSSTLLAEVHLPNASKASNLESLIEHTPDSPVRKVTLDIPAGSYFAEPGSRGLLKYLVSCALGADTHAQLKLPDETLTLTGNVGLAPGWAARGMTLAEQRWVSACMFALTNRLGINVRISIRGNHPSIAESTITDDERRTYRLHEAGFFGNLFAPDPVGYVCEGVDRERMLEVPVGKSRLCAQPSGLRNAAGQAISQCGFVITGACNSPASFGVHGDRYDAVVHTWVSAEPAN